MKIVGINRQATRLFRDSTPVRRVRRRARTGALARNLEQLDCAELTCLVMGSLSCILVFWRLAGKHKVDREDGHFPGTYAIFLTALALP